MKTNRKNLISQRTLIEKKLRPWIALRADNAPRSGWIKAVRGALGINTRQLADRVGVEQSNITRLEEREPQGKVTLERLAPGRRGRCADRVTRRPAAAEATSGAPTKLPDSGP